MVLGPIGGFILLLFVRAIWRKIRGLYERKFPSLSKMTLSIAASASVFGLYILFFALAIASVYVFWG